ncbi:MAG: hypothetical protein J6K84_02615 [Oscillospiraceae bacterium]|nr:hypothetical protein [Oscillospiraceae bacterium]
MENFGTLTVYAYTSDARLPVEGARVTIRRSCDENAEILADAVTDRSGYIPPTRIPTSAPSQSQSPDQATPFTTVCIRISHPAYETEQTSGVQVFPNIITVQNFRMVPINPMYGDETLEFDTPEQNL